MQEERLPVGQDNPEALKQWLLASGRKYMVFNAVDLVDALEWPGDLQQLQQIVEAYRNYRRTKDTNKVELQQTLEGVEVPVQVAKDEVLEPEEKEELWRQLGNELGLTS